MYTSQTHIGVVKDILAHLDFYIILYFFAFRKRFANISFNSDIKCINAV